MIDTHCHLLDESYNNDRREVIERAFAEGITKIIEISVEPSLWQNSVELCKKYSNIFCSFGIHPHDAERYTDYIHLISDEKVVAVGECGLDYHRDSFDKKIQAEIFEKQLEIAKKFNKPVIVHSREAEEDSYNILSRYKDLKGVIHCFSSTPGYAEKFLSLGFYLGIDCPVTYPKADNLKKVVKQVPIERILLETDAPYLPPQKFRGKRNEPSYIKYIAEEIAKIKNIPIDAVSEITDNNAKNLFGI
ncbi:MAG: hypothetical protein A2474_03180 [Elusimicrobia bacterium RIFOXYC2_FULL_34_12]|nr:MAG: hypothetical protein A2474_03180 [Elusimicrobia bacterium RIFOXYC2_FULL_34_12]OGS39500.1 MAG: hypothetical protein A2551_00175 [Elusimicrobia bacterium RIFOXYD2_FULL_34_30]HAM39581.1 hypothetical protein [Elusimicrobiota bacterium]